MRFGDVPHDREPEAEPAVTARAGAVGLAEALKHQRQEVRANALSRVVDDDFRHRFARAQLELDLPVGRRELDGVRQQIPHDLLQPLGIALDEDVDIGRRLHHQSDALGLRRQQVRFDRGR